MTTVAIMQPTYLPWLGYFALMDRVDVFVFLDSVQFERRSWQQRNRIKGADGPQTLTVPVHKKGLRAQRIAEAQIDFAAGFPHKHVRAIKHCYARAPYFDRYSAELFVIMQRSCNQLVELTIGLIDWLAEQLGIASRCLRSGTLGAEGREADLLADICRRLEADCYVSPPGSMGYLANSDAFERLGIPVVYNEYDHPTYPQLHGTFVSHMSVLDLMFNAGPDSLNIIREGVV